MISLTYGYYNNGILTWLEARSLNELRFIISRQTERIKGKLLNGYFYSHLLTNRYTYELTVSADELIDNTNLEFIKAFFEAEAWKINDEEVFLLDDGDMPITYLEDNIDLKEITLKFVKKIPG